MEPSAIKHLHDKLASAGVLFASGLTDSELLEIYAFHDFRFPPDLEELYRYRLPVSDGFYNWREYDSEAIIDAMERPIKGILFDVHHNDFWVDECGKRPREKDAREGVIREYFQGFPKLIPVYSHRYIPDYPHEEGNPVYSAQQTDIIIYGTDLQNYFDAEFCGGETIDYSKVKRIKDWHKFIINYNLCFRMPGEMLEKLL
ncbi:hypothetical protein OR1_03497 [Geobacter sp. OR-1]|uniref:hypothetical protein n=1 Tax=Geobacter sp. OR-1 TaxID=1266765 RepID=UPI0005439EB6|nr:hypothetical protein [Geobacter sp. OR-1]GAM11187.1 hypothetical protein OR1_03497 [Geobacter sp. OR-1]